MKSGYHHDDGTQNLAEHNVILQETEERSVVDAAAVRGVILRIFTSSFEDRKLSTVERSKLLPLVYWAKKQPERHPVTHKDLLLCLGVNRTDSSADVCRKPWPFPRLLMGTTGAIVLPRVHVQVYDGTPSETSRLPRLDSSAGATAKEENLHFSGSRSIATERASCSASSSSTTQNKYSETPTNCNAYAAVHL